VAVSVNMPGDVDADGQSNNHVETTGQKLVERCALIPVLRSGLGMTDAMQELLPNAASYHIGMYKSSTQSHPVMYYNRLPRRCLYDVAYVLDPVIATASTVTSVVKLLKKVRSGSPALFVRLDLSLGDSRPACKTFVIQCSLYVCSHYDSTGIRSGEFQRSMSSPSSRRGAA
jgi:hypothetical protein